MSDNTTAIIVALPSEMDSIRLVGDEEKHATLLFFGETATLPDEAKSVFLNALEQATKVFSSFHERVVDVSRLGNDNPPALVANLSGDNLSKVRDVLLVNAGIDVYRKNTPQFPTYTPHVTLDYPDYQGEVKLRDLAMRVNRIRFDRLALWWNDERFEFGLYDTQNGSGGEVEMSEDLETFLAHHGIKGMRWGIRRNKDQGSGSGTGTDGVHKEGEGSTIKSMKKAEPGSVVTMTREDGSHQTLVKKKDGTWAESFISADAERFVKTRNKEAHELSDRELNEALNRAKKIKEYNELFSDDPHAALKRKVKELELERDYARLKAELRPPSATKRLSNLVSSFVSTGSKGWDDYKKADAVYQEFQQKREDSKTKAAAKAAAKVAASAAFNTAVKAATGQKPGKVRVSTAANAAYRFRTNPAYNVGKGLGRS